ncbi:hypothetical protein NDU88_004874 [Pleurodeles waltl]|uniref:Uncharacterized protein n=1 Tax=Pleurodeles waltl TaxID=8319 RepID=A0AAV7LMZ4_PLEWA|nr:hypothetical protein NDU88_004874 [Pleurodeles waltl]
MSPGQPGKFAQACFVGRASGDKKRWKHGAAQGGEAAVQRVVRGSEADELQFPVAPQEGGAAELSDQFFLEGAEYTQQPTKQPPLKPTKVQMYAFGNTQPLQIANVFTAGIAHKDTKLTAKIYVLQEESGFLHTCQTAQDLGLIHFATGLGDLTEEFEALFIGIGPKRAPIEASHQRVRHRRVDFHLRPNVEREL